MLPLLNSFFFLIHVAGIRAGLFLIEQAQHSLKYFSKFRHVNVTTFCFSLLENLQEKRKF